MWFLEKEGIKVDGMLINVDINAAHTYKTPLNIFNYLINP